METVAFSTNEKPLDLAALIRGKRAKLSKTVHEL